MKEFDAQSSERSPTSGTFAEARTGLFRATLLFGTIAAALAMIVVPATSRHGRMSGSDVQGLDLMTTGSIPSARVSGPGALEDGPLRYSLSRMDGGVNEPCLLFPDGTQRGSC